MIWDLRTSTYRSRPATMCSRIASLVASTAAVALVATGCGGAKPGDGSGGEGSTGAEGAEVANTSGDPYGPAPSVPKESLDPEVEAAIKTLMSSAATGTLDRDALDVVTGSGDPRLAWYDSDLLRFFGGSSDDGALVDAFSELTGVDPSDDPAFAESSWLSITNHLIAWDLPAPPDYREGKAVLFEAVEPGWKPFFADADSAIDWRLVSWGGVQIDGRPAGATGSCPQGCIPALDDPALTPASEGDWYPDQRIVFGVIVGGEAVAFPKNIMEIHEMVNATIGGRRLGIPYCTLCGSAQAYFLDRVGGGLGEPVLRTSGLLARSNKVMYDLTTRSVLDTFTGEALSGPLHDAGVTLPQTTVVASTWGEWKRAHPNTEIVARDGGIGRDYPLDPLGGRDDNGPIFPIGDADPRLPVQENVVGVSAPGGGAVAFPVDDALAALDSGERVTEAGVEVLRDGDGLRAVVADEGSGEGREAASHQSFWFAWSQFHPDTALWEPVGG